MHVSLFHREQEHVDYWGGDDKVCEGCPPRPSPRQRGPCAPQPLHPPPAALYQEEVRLTSASYPNQGDNRKIQEQEATPGSG